LFSRDFSLASTEAWVRGESTNPKEWTKEKQPYLPYIITERSDDTVHFYYNLQGVEWVQDLLVKIAHEDTTFLKKIETIVLEKLKFIRPIYEKGIILDSAQLKRFIKELEEGYPWVEVRKYTKSKGSYGCFMQRFRYSYKKVFAKTVSIFRRFIICFTYRGDLNGKNPLQRKA
jgi:hypothetical protein